MSIDEDLERRAWNKLEKPMEDKYTEEQIREAWQKINNHHDWKDMNDKSLWQLLAELKRPKPKFEKGQVAIVKNGLGERIPVIVGNKLYTQTNLLPMDLTEHGPAVRKLRQFVNGLTYAETPPGLAKDAQRALAAFDAEVPE